MERYGVPKGIPEAVRNRNLSQLRQRYPWFFVVLKVKSVDHHSAIPVSSILSQERNEEGEILSSRQWKAPEVGSYVELTNVDVDLWEQNGIEFFEEAPYCLGYRSGAVEYDSAALIRRLYLRRKRAKAESRKALANALKLLMVSSLLSHRTYALPNSEMNDRIQFTEKPSRSQMIVRLPYSEARMTK